MKPEQDMPWGETSMLFTRMAMGLLAVFSLAACYAISVQQYFYTDGAHFFLKLLEQKTFIYNEYFSRHHAHYLTQALTVVLLKAGVKDIGILSWSFGLGLYLPLVIGFALCVRVAMRTDARFLLFPVIALFGISANHSFIMIHESHVTAALFWPLFFYALLQDRFEWMDTAIVLALALLFIRTYESVAILGTILTVVLILRCRERWREATSLTHTVWALTVLILLVGIVIAVYCTLYPLNPENRGDFLASFIKIPGHWPAMLSLAFLAVIGLFLLAPKVALSPFFAVLAVAFAGLAIFVGLSPVLAPDLMRPEKHHAARSYMAFLVPPLLAMLAFPVIRRVVVVPDRVWRRVAVLMAILAIGQTTWQVLATGQWNGFRRVFREELAAHRGVTAFEDTTLGKERLGIQLVRPMTWPWTQPTLSILWSPGQNVRTIIINPVSYGDRWQPFNPLVAGELPKVEDLGFSFASYKSRFSPAPENRRPP